MSHFYKAKLKNISKRISLPLSIFREIIPRIDRLNGSFTLHKDVNGIMTNGQWQKRYI